MSSATLCLTRGVAGLPVGLEVVLEHLGGPWSLPDISTWAELVEPRFDVQYRGAVDRVQLGYVQVQAVYSEQPSAGYPKPVDASHVPMSEDADLRQCGVVASTARAEVQIGSVGPGYRQGVAGDRARPKPFVRAEVFMGHIVFGDTPMFKSIGNVTTSTRWKCFPMLTAGPGCRTSGCTSSGDGAVLRFDVAGQGSWRN